MWVLILFYLTSANGSFAVHDFASQAACEHAREVAQGVRSPGLERVQAVCVPKQLLADGGKRRGGTDALPKAPLSKFLTP